ncbi:MAG: hypothetical protein RI101_02070 [Nitrospira sp.]|nr:hypothetical protein [Nitrospira sp.]
MCTLWLDSSGQAQVGGGGMGSFGGATDPSMVQVVDGFRLVPSISAAERYDSNVFLTPKTSGVDRSDYVSTLKPQIRGLFDEGGMKANAVVGATAEYYAKNRNFNYIGANAGLSLNLGSILDPLWQGMKATVTDTFSYTPVPPAFLVGEQTGSTTTSSQVAYGGPNGIQVGRVSSISNALGVSLTAPVSQTLNLAGSYSRGFFRFGTSEVQQTGLLLNTSSETIMAGVQAKLSPQDTLSLNYTQSTFTYEDASGLAFTTRGGMLGWAHLFSPTVTMTSTAGVQIFEGGGVSSVSGSSNSSSSLVPTAGLGLTWKDQTTMLSLAYGLSLTPSYQFEAQPILTNTVSFSVKQVMPIPDLVGLLSANYARGDQFGSTSANSISYSSYGGSSGILYKITTKTFLNLNYQYMKFDSQFGSQAFSMDRHLVSLNITQAFY